MTAMSWSATRMSRALLPWILGSVACWSSCGAAAAQGVTPVPGEIAISEILFDPTSGVDDNYGEYFEVTNISNRVLDFSGLFVQDLAASGSTSAPYFMISPGVLPSIYPGQAIVFARSGDPTVNGGLNSVHYVYSVPSGTSAPADKSKVSHTAMALGNSSIDLIAITTGAPLNLGGFVIEMVTYDPTKAPLTNHSGIAFERGDLMAPWQASNVAASTGAFGSFSQQGTPGEVNSNDKTLYPSWYRFDAVQPGPQDLLLLLPKGPCSASKGSTLLKLTGGPPGASFGIAFSASPMELPMPTLGGTVLVDLWSAEIWATSQFQLDGAGVAEIPVALQPAMIGAQVSIQWYAYEPVSGMWYFSNGLSADVVP